MISANRRPYGPVGNHVLHPLGRAEIVSLILVNTKFVFWLP